MAGLILDPWQQRDLTDALGEREDGKWASLECGLCVPRQNGKGSILEARELAGLYLLPEKLIVHSAHEFSTSLEAFRRLLELIESTPDLDQLVQRVSRSHGEEGIELKDGSRIRFRTRTKGGGRGLSADCVILDEAMILALAMIGALMPTLSAKPNPQLWYTGSAVDKEIHEHGIVWSRIRDRGIKGDDPALMYVEYSGDREHPDEVTPQDAIDPEMRAAANPGLGIRITSEFTDAEQRSMDHRTFCVERLGVGDWFDDAGEDGDGVTKAVWDAAENVESILVDPVRIAVDVHPDRIRSAIASAGRNREGMPHIELINHERGTAWVPGRVKALLDTHKVAGKVLIIARSPAAALIPKLNALGIEVEEVDQADYGKACGAIVDDLVDGAVVHIGQPKLQAAALGAKQRSSGETPVWSRKSSAVDICPFVAATVAHYAASAVAVSKYEDEELEIW